jgi:hypothetical protein
MMNILRLIPYFYEAEYRIKLALCLYGYQYSVYCAQGDPPWQWWQYLLGNLNDRPQPIISFREVEDAIAYLQKYPTKGLYVLRERYVP